MLEVRAAKIQVPVFSTAEWLLVLRHAVCPAATASNSLASAEEYLVRVWDGVVRGIGTSVGTLCITFVAAVALSCLFGTACSSAGAIGVMLLFYTGVTGTKVSTIWGNILHLGKTVFALGVLCPDNPNRNLKPGCGGRRLQNHVRNNM